MGRFRFFCLGIVGAAALSLTMAEVADAGGRGGPGHRDGLRGQVDQEQIQARHQEHRARMVETLGLTEDQQTQLDALHESHRSAVGDLRASEDVSREAMRALREEHREAFQAILTAEQLEILQQLRTERGPRGRMGHAHGEEGAHEEVPGTDTVANDDTGEGAGKAAVANTTWAQLKMDVR